MDSEKAVRANQRGYLAKIRKKPGNWSVFIGGNEIIIFPGVFPPRTDTKLLARNIKTKEGERILDVGTGTGVLAVVAGMQGASGFAIDINSLAVENANFNFKKNKLAFKAILSDMFLKAPKEKFDYILATGPYLDDKIKKPIDYGIYGMKKFMSDLFFLGPHCLKKGGKMLVTFPEWSDLDFFENLLKSNNLSFKVIDKLSSHDGQRTYHLYECFEKV